MNTERETAHDPAPGAYIGGQDELAHEAGAIDLESTGPGAKGAVRDEVGSGRREAIAKATRRQTT